MAINLIGFVAGFRRRRNESHSPNAERNAVNLAPLSNEVTSQFFGNISGKRPASFFFFGECESGVLA